MLLGSTLLLAPSTASATLLIGFEQFDNLANSEGADYSLGGFSGSVIDGAGQASVATGGSNDTTYGNTSLAEHNPAANNGYLRSLEAGDPVVQVTNTSAGAYSLTSLLFDAASQAGGGNVIVTYRQGTTGAWLNLFTTGTLPIAGAAGTSANYADYLVNLVGLGITLLNGQTIQFKFDGQPNARIDNIAVTGLSAIPEPASLLALGCLLGSGLFLRQRRSVKTA